MLLLMIIIIIKGLIIILDKSDKYKKIHNDDKLVIKAAMSAEKG